MIHDFIYLYLKEQLKQVAEIKTTELDYDQDSDDKQENSLINTPAILVNFEGETPTDDLGDGYQEMDMEVVLKLVTVNYRWKDERIRKTDKTNHHDVARLVFRHFQKVKSGRLSEIPEFADLSGTDNDECMVSTIRRSAVSFDQSHSIFIRSSQTFTMRVVDFSGSKNYQKVSASLQIDWAELML